MANTIDIDVGDSLLVGPRGPQGEIGPRGYGIKKIDKTGSNKLVDTYTVTFDDNRTATFEVTNGKGIASIDLTSTVENVDTYTITYNDETTSTFTVTNSNVSREEFEEALELTNSEMDDGLEEGEDVQLKGVAKTDLDITVCGNTKQETTEGYNLLPNRQETQTKAGVTATRNSDGSLTLNGTATADVNFVIVPGTETYTLSAGTYTLSGCPEGGGTSTYRLLLHLPGADKVDYGSGTTFTLGEEIIYNYVAINIKNETTFNNLTFKPMVVEGSEPKPYEPYSGGVPSPSPSYPQDIQVVTGENTVVIEGKNLQEMLFTDGSSNGLSWHIESDGSIIINGTSTGNVDIRRNNLMPVVEGETYTLSATGMESITNFGYKHSGSNVVVVTPSSPSFTFEATSDMISEANNLDLYIISGKTFKNQRVTIQLEKGSTATEYEPYFEPQSYPLSLGEMKLAGVDESNRDYIHEDGTKWYKHEAIFEKVFNGNESWEKDTGYFNCNASLGGIAGQGYTNYYKYGSLNTLNNFVITTNTFRVNADFETLEDYKNWLSTHNVILYYVLATPTEVEITDTTLIQQLEALSKATAKGNNFIVTTETDGLKPILKVQYKESTRAKADNLEERVETLENQIKGAGHVYGIKRKRVDNSSSKWERTDDSIGLVANATHDGTEVQNDFDNLSPWKDIISFNLDLETGKKKAYYGDPDFKFDGSNGDVYTHIPDIYYKVWQDEDYDYVQIADFAKTGFIKCDAFDIQRYKAGIVGDVLHSYSNIPAAAYNNIVTYRTMARELGEDYCLLDWRYFIIQLLYLVEYADYNSQAKLGNGYTSMRKNTADVSLLAETNTHRFVVNTNAGNAFVVGQTVCVGTANEKYDIAESRKITAITDYDSGGITGKSITLDGAAFTTTITSVIWSSAQHSGQCDSLGMKSGCLANDSKHEVIYRGIEDLYGNILQWIDGINIKDHQVYVCYNPDDYVSDKFESPYEAIGYVIAAASGYSKTLGFDINNPLIRFPIEVGGGSNTYMTDYYYQNSGNRAAHVGGNLGVGAAGGTWSWVLSNPSSYAYWACGARLLRYQK